MSMQIPGLPNADIGPRISYSFIPAGCAVIALAFATLAVSPTPGMKDRIGTIRYSSHFDRFHALRQHSPDAEPCHLAILGDSSCTSLCTLMNDHMSGSQKNSAHDKHTNKVIFFVTL